MTTQDSPQHEGEGLPFIDSWEGTARIFVSNILYGTDEHTKQKSAEVIISIAKALDTLVAEVEAKFGTKLPSAGGIKDAS